MPIFDESTQPNHRSISLLNITSALSLSLFLASLSTAAPAQSQAADSPAQPVASDVVFPAEYFVQYAPRTALDMVSRIPGFTLVVADERRGLGQGGANILVNGKRLTGKTDPAEQLGRIGAANVMRIEILDGAILSIPGLSGQVANIYTQTNGVAGTWTWAPEFRSGIEPDWFRGEISIAGKTGDLEYDLKLENRSLRVRKSGPELLTNRDGLVFETRDEEIKEYSDRPGIGLNLSYKPAPGHIANLNAEYKFFKFRGTGTSDQIAVTPLGSDIDTLFSVAGNQWSAKAGADYEFPFGNGSLKLIGFYSFNHSPPMRQFDIFDGSNLVGRSRFSQVSDKSELIGRGEYSWKNNAGHDWQLSIEGAFNKLEVENKLLRFGANGIQTNGSLDKFMVGEDRTEIFVTHSRQLSPEWSFQISLGGEYSILSQTRNGLQSIGDQNFLRPKGFATTTYKISPTLNLRLRAERQVGQLNFLDFVSSTNLQDNLDVTANPTLVPQQSWLGSIELDKNLGGGNRMKVKLFGERITDIVDLVPVGASGEGVGNLDQAHRFGINLSSTLRGDQWGIAGAQLDLQLELQKSALKDPLQGFSRPINADRIFFYKAAFRHDIVGTDWAYGLSAERENKALEYRLFSFSESNVTLPQVRAFAEHKDIAGLKLVMEIANIVDQGEILQRTFFSNRRDIGQELRTERRVRKLRPFISLRLSGEF